jgi:hypothetical protein
MLTPCTSDFLPVGAIPISSPVCVPRPVQWVTTRSPSAIKLSMVTRASGKAVRYDSAYCRKPAGPGGVPGGPLRWTPSPATSSSSSARSCLFQTSSHQRRTIALFSSVDIVRSPSSAWAVRRRAGSVANGLSALS